MAIEKQYTITVSTKQAQANIDELNASFNLQELYIEGVMKRNLLWTETGGSTLNG